MAKPGPNAAVRRPDTLGEELFQSILGLVDSGELAPGSIVNEAALALRFGVSRGPVREAIRRLQGIQLVTREPFMRARVVSLEPRAIVELFEMREALEGFACRLAATAMPAAAIDQLAGDLEAARAADGPAADFDFHERIVRGCGNQRIIESLCGDLYHLLRMYRRSSGAVPARKERAFAEHWQILRAIQARDPDLAESLMRSHIARAGQHILTKIPEGPGHAKRGD